MSETAILETEGSKLRSVPCGPDDLVENSAAAFQESSCPLWLLRRSDQAVVAGLVLLAGVGMWVWWHVQAGSEGRLVDIDQASPLKAEFRVDINQATWPELAQLPGIGPSLARRIVEYRMTYGPFRCLQDVEKVRGVGPKKLQQIQPYLVPLPKDCPPNSP